MSESQAVNYLLRDRLSAALFSPFERASQMQAVTRGCPLCTSKLNDCSNSRLQGRVTNLRSKST
jgi:hypothetical protein